MIESSRYQIKSKIHFLAKPSLLLSEQEQIALFNIESQHLVMAESLTYTKTFHHTPYPAIDVKNPKNSVAGKIVVVTGGSMGIGEPSLWKSREENILSALRKLFS
jgi:hypothetical protein